MRASILSCEGRVNRIGEQQNGQVVDRQTGDAVAVAGTAAYFGATIGAAIYAALGK
jgi:hypothetical protein